MSTENNNLCERLVAARSRRGTSQKTVARLAGIDPSYLSRVESGKVHPTVRTVMKIANALGVSANDLLGSPPRGSEDRPCPVSPSGQCLGDLVRIHADGGQTNSFTPLQLRVLRSFASLLQQRRPEVLKALHILFSEMAIEK